MTLVVACLRAYRKHPDAIVREYRQANPGMDEDIVRFKAFDEIAEGIAAQSIIDAAESDAIDRASRS